jgi:hypothetical protein
VIEGATSFPLELVTVPLAKAAAAEEEESLSSTANVFTMASQSSLHPTRIEENRREENFKLI